MNEAIKEERERGRGRGRERKKERERERERESQMLDRTTVCSGIKLQTSSNGFFQLKWC